ncbi:transposase, partial [Clostridium sp. 19966]|uniref:transposase n=1 Tax=Clostridium sp. 19966 TaxID=2768166 RepID=UPI0028DD501A
LAAYIILGINEDGRKEVLSIQIGENESSKYWLSVLNELKNRGVADILILCTDGLTGIKESIWVAFPNTEYQRCIVHQVRNTLKYVADKDKKQFAADVRKVIYTTNAIESLNSTYRRLNKQRSVFPSDTALLKALYLATFEATKKWTLPLRNWGKVYGELSIMYEGRLQ